MYQSGQSQSVDGGLPSKTPVSLLQELCMRRGIFPIYDFLQIEGPFNEQFVCRVTVGEFVANGSGQTKQKAKHAAAKAVLDIIIQDGSGGQGQAGSTPELSSQIVSPYDDGIPGNPVGALQELCMSRRWPPPTYELAAEEGFPPERTFFICCTVGNHKEIGSAKRKKLSKRQAAIKILQKLKDQPAEQTSMNVLAEDHDEVKKQSGSPVTENYCPTLNKAFPQDMSSKMSGINFETAAKRLLQRHLVELNRYFYCPEDYPKYRQKWESFVEKRKTDLLSTGGDVMNYDYHTEFEEKWKKEIWKKKERCLSHLLKSKHKYDSLEEVILTVEHRVKHNIWDSSSSSSSSSLSTHHSKDNKKDKSENKPKRRISWFSSSSLSSSSDASSDHSRSPERRRKRRRSGNSKRCSSICRKRSHTSSCSCKRDHKPRRRRSSSSEDSFRSRSRSLSHKRPKSRTSSRSQSSTGSRARSRSKSSLNRKKYHSRSRSRSTNNYGKKFASTDVSRFGFCSGKSSSSNFLSRRRSKSSSKSRTFSKRSRSRSISKDSISKRSRSRTGSRRPRSRTGSRSPRSGSASKSDRSRSRSMSLSVIPKSVTTVKSRSRSDSRSQSRSRTTPKISRSRSISGNNSNIKNDKIESGNSSSEEVVPASAVTRQPDSNNQSSEKRPVRKAAENFRKFLKENFDDL